MELIIWNMVFKTGWTLEYINGLSMEHLRDYINIMDATNKARAIG
jgi:hypothetical protein